ncbi:hypothetical protein JCM5350_001252 [Sporobolomyces pararoseus]
MGNNASTPSSATSHPHLSSRGDRGSTAQLRSSPRPRNISLPSTEDFRPSRTSSLAERRKKKSNSNTGGGGGGGTDSQKPSLVNRLPSITVGTGYQSRRKGAAVVDDEADVDDDEAGEGSDDVDGAPRPGSGVGTLRGAMQGKAEHVVYGPKRVDDGTGFVASPVPGGMAKVVPIKAIPTVGNATTARSDAVARGEMRSGSSNTNTIKDNLGETAAANELETGNNRRKLKSPMDPDDTMHPDYRDSARLTPEVLMSTESMPVLSSPKGEEPPAESPFTPSEEGQTQEGGEDQRKTRSAPTTTESSIANLPKTSSTTRNVITPTTSFSHAASSIFAPTSPFSPTSPQSVPAHLPSESDLLPPHSSTPNPPSHAPVETVLAPPVPTEALPLSAESIPSGTSVIASPTNSKVSTPTGQTPSPAVLLPPTLFNAPVAAIPIPLLSVPSPTIAQNLIAAAVDLGAGENGVPTLIKWKNEDGQEERKGVKKGPKEVYVTGTFANGWKVKIELRKTDATDFSALISLPPGPHRLKFIVDNEWKASKHLPVATDADGNLINYLQVNPVDTKLPANLWTTTIAAATQSPTSPTSSTYSQSKPANTSSVPPTAVPINVGQSHSVHPSSRLREQAVARSAGQSVSNSYNSQWPGILAELGGAPTMEDEGGIGGGGESGQGGVYDEDDFATWTQEIPPELEQWGEWELERDQIESDWLAANPNPTNSTPGPVYPPQPPSAGVPPPTLPAQLEKGPLNHAAYVTMGSGDDNSILPKPDHSVINHLAASPIKGGFLSVGVTTRYKRKFVTIVYYKALAR